MIVLKTDRYGLLSIVKLNTYGFLCSVTRSDSTLKSIAKIIKNIKKIVYKRRVK
jgi:hypothetical protein